MSWISIHRTHVVFIMLSLCLIAGAAFGQTGTTSVRGTVLDKTGAAIVGASVKISHKETGLERSTTTGDTGG
ncbi:MAG TPA: carboxypeptidase-like regulatory domain-containing protein, partial [Candidatus Limnocylindrales bacterium]|nr:carboxypeptidase-like regulatory domain-containing protein [Candidatus Limnocylindrales bacterium]